MTNLGSQSPSPELMDRIRVVVPLLRARCVRHGAGSLRFTSDPSAGADWPVVDLPPGADPSDIFSLIDALAPAGRGFRIPDIGAFAFMQAAGEGRAAGTVAVVTGAAQGVGLEIARRLAIDGAQVVLADIHESAARDAAAAINEVAGRDAALGVAMNVTAAASIHAALDAVILRHGGFDLLVSNAGVLKAGSVKTQPEADFDFVTAVNYKGFFLCVQAAAPILAARRRADPDAWTDIIQVNSKSGLVGSNRNGAYAGSKFGGVGLVQSFALELIEDGIKVNAICPGNFFDLPLWSNPDTGLFVQYLRTGKVPGARAIDDVRRAYEAKVPMGRGCRVDDLMRALYYLVEQHYETGQALPVTGGQVMSH